MAVAVDRVVGVHCCHFLRGWHGLSAAAGANELKTRHELMSLFNRAVGSLLVALAALMSATSWNAMPSE